jgi:uncharacterized protein (TIGR03086 family)
LAEHLCGSLVALGGCVGVTVEADQNAPLEPRVADLAQPVLEGWRGHGLEGTVHLGSGDIPASTAAGILPMEFLVHAWDFARATGHQIPTSDGLATYVLGLAHSLIQPALRNGDAFAEEVPVGADADPMARLAAYTGREP